MSVSRVRENRMPGSMRRREETNASRPSRAASGASRRPYRDRLMAIEALLGDSAWHLRRIA
jgi:predicted secreted protein